MIKILIQSTWALTWLRTAALQASGPSASSPLYQKWPPVPHDATARGHDPWAYDPTVLDRSTDNPVHATPGAQFSHGGDAALEHDAAVAHRRQDELVLRQVPLRFRVA